MSSLARRRLRGWRPEAPRPASEAPAAGPPAVALPTIFHVTYWKAGSQWLNKILNRCVGDRVVFAEQDKARFLEKPLRAGKVYTTCYLTRDEFYSVSLPEPWHRFVVIRDLRDTAVSYYFSIRFSHVDHPAMVAHREQLNALTFEEGLLYVLADRLPGCAAIQQTWVESGEEPIRYEDLLERDVEILEPLLTRKCPLGVPAEQVREAVLACRFERLTGGRPRPGGRPLARAQGCRRGLAPPLHRPRHARVQGPLRRPARRHRLREGSPLVTRAVSDG